MRATAEHDAGEGLEAAAVGGEQEGEDHRGQGITDGAGEAAQEGGEGALDGLREAQ